MNTCHNRARCLFAWLCACVVALTGLPAVSCGETETHTLEYPVLYMGGTHRETVRFGGALFDEPSSVYCPDLAFVSSLMSSLADKGARIIADDSTLSASSRTRMNANAILDALKKLGFEDAEAYHYDDLSRENTGLDTNGYSFGHRTLTNASGESFALIAVIARGTMFNEWYSNFNVGQGSVMHQGFDAAAREMLDTLNAYIDRTGLSASADTNRIWLTGHSRGAAVVNAAAAMLCQSETLAAHEHVYAYTFATPNVINVCTENTHANALDAAQGVYPQPDDSIYAGIFNFVNRDDFVTYVSPWVCDADGDMMMDVLQNPDALAALEANDGAEVYRYIRQGKYGLTIAFSPLGDDAHALRTAAIIKEISGTPYNGYSIKTMIKLVDAFIGFTGNTETGYAPITLTNGEVITPCDFFVSLFEDVFISGNAAVAAMNLSRAVLLMPQKDTRPGSQRDAQTVAQLLVFTNAASGGVFSAHMPGVYIAAVQAYNEALSGLPDATTEE